MPFGAVFASLLLGLVGLLLPVSALSADSAPIALGRVALGLICLNVSLGLLRKQPWARWGALFVAAVLLVLHDLVVPPGGAVAKLAILLGAVTAILLLAIPPTGKLARRADRKPGHALKIASSAGVLALSLSLVWGALAETEFSSSSDGPIQISGLSPRIAWNDFGSGLERAEAESKPLFVSFETNWCGYCKKMNRTTFKDTAVVERLNEIVAVRINAEDDKRINGYSGRELASRYGVAGYPSLMMLNSRGEVQARVSGFLDAREFLDWVDDGMRERTVRKTKGAAKPAS